MTDDPAESFRQAHVAYEIPTADGHTELEWTRTLNARWARDVLLYPVAHPLR